MSSFDKLVAQLQEETLEQRLGQTRELVTPVMNRIHKALMTTALDESKLQKLFEIVNAAFQEANLPLLQKHNSDPSTIELGESINVGSCIAGVYPTQAYNVEVYASTEGLKAYVWKVPKDGNSRT